MARADDLTRRESQIMDVIYVNGEISAAEVRAAMPDAPSYSAVRAVLSRLVDKGLLTYREKGLKYAYRATTPQQSAGKAALAHLVDTFFGGSPADTFGALLGAASERLSEDELAKIERLIAAARERQK
ncbi:MAG: BlaI/MecI/CopY family transcriptional regulator [Proteobacteria bacterium]|nr:BlaI/MecI/CopY family transcriptional regulator [Pseudomonadota bacterium]